MNYKELLFSFNQIKEGLCCPLDEGFLEPRLLDGDLVQIYCTSCSWKQTLGDDAARRISEIRHTLTP